MDFDTFQQLALRTYKAELTHRHLMVNGALGLTGESGEVADIIKKHVYPSKPGDGLDTQARLIDELGNVLWYIAILAKGAGISLVEIAQHNIAKLARRHSLDEGVARVVDLREAYTLVLRTTGECRSWMRFTRECEKLDNSRMHVSRWRDSCTCTRMVLEGFPRFHRRGVSVGYARHVDEDVDANKQQPADALLAAINHLRQAGAIHDEVSVTAAWMGGNRDVRFSIAVPLQT